MAPAASTLDGGNGSSLPAILSVVFGSVGFVAVVIVGVCLYVHRQSVRRRTEGAQKQMLLPKMAPKPVIGFKTAAGPGGLKKSPSPVQSPENEKDFQRESERRLLGDFSGGGGGEGGSSLSGGPLEKLVEEVPGECDSNGSFTPESSSSSLATSLVGDDFINMNSDCNENIINMDKVEVSEIMKNAGELAFKLRYNFDTNALMVTILGAADLPKRENQGGDGETVLDPYIKLQLLPEKQHKVKTRVVKNTQNPEYDEDFTFYGLTYNQLQSTTLHFAAISFDRYSRDEILGELLCPLFSLDLSDSDKEITLTMPLATRNYKFQNAPNRGDLLASLCYQPATNKVTAVVLKARNLPKFDVTGLADPYVKMYLLYNGQRVAKKKSHVKKRTLNPVYNESFVFEMPTRDPSKFDKVSVEFFVMDWDRLTKNEVMGRVEVGGNVINPAGRTHWREMCQNPRRQTAQWHKLRP